MSAGAARSTDSTGRSWSGRALKGTGFDGDDGSADSGLVAAIADPDDERGLMAALARARLLVPVVTDDGDMASITLTTSDGQRTLPVFSSAAALAAWNAAARPVPVTAARAGQAAVSERCDVLVVDLGSDAPLLLRPSMVWALAQQREWLPAHQDPFVADAVRRAAGQEPDVHSVSVGPGLPGTGVLRVVLRMRPGLDAGLVAAVATRVGERIATDGETRARIDALTFAIRPA